MKPIALVMLLAGFAAGLAIGQRVESQVQRHATAAQVSTCAKSDKVKP